MPQASNKFQMAQYLFWSKSYEVKVFGIDSFLNSQKGQKLNAPKFHAGGITRAVLVG